MNKNLDKKYDPKCFKTRQIRQFGGHIFLVFLPWAWGLGFEEESPLFFRVWGLPAVPKSECNLERFRGVSGALPEFLSGIPSRTEGALILEDRKLDRKST